MLPHGSSVAVCLLSRSTHWLGSRRCLQGIYVLTALEDRGDFSLQSKGQVRLLFSARNIMSPFREKSDRLTARVKALSCPSWYSVSVMRRTVHSRVAGPRLHHPAGTGVWGPGAMVLLWLLHCCGQYSPWSSASWCRASSREAVAH